MPSRDEQTSQFYSKTAETYVAAGSGGTSRFLQAFMDMLPAGSRVLELGCGSGRDAQAMIAAGFDVDPTDGTPEIALQAQALLKRKVRVMRFDELADIAFYDAVWANASLLHVPRSSLTDVLAKVYAALKPGGLHFASYKAGGLEGRDSHGRYFNYLSSHDAADMYRRSSPWEILSIEEYEGGGYQGTRGPWIAVLARSAPATPFR
jgi:SAM-dependent methyltransferase